jgi:hypothetical protein
LGGQLGACQYVLGTMAGDMVSGCGVPEPRDFGPAPADRERTARVEDTASRRVRGVRWVARQDDPGPALGYVNFRYG